MSSQELVVVRSSGLSSFEQAGEFGEGWLSPAGGDVDGRVHDRDPEGFDGPDRRDGVLEQERPVHRVDAGRLGGLVVDEQER